MNTMLKRVISLMLCIVLVTSCLPVSALAVESGEAVAAVTTEVTTEPSTEATEPEVVAVTGITLDRTTLQVGVGELPITLTATVLPEDATDKTVTWTSSEPGVASVADGVLTFGYMGEAVITATCGEYSATCVVTVGEGDSTDYAGDATIVIAGSDFQHDAGDSAGAKTVTGILNQVKEDYSSVDGFLFSGDYSNNYDYNSSESGKNALIKAVHGVFGTIDHEVYLQGNHDVDSLVTDRVFSASGANDTSDYGVFVIHEQDYMWHNDNKARIQQTASNLDAYLDAKVAEGYTDPIFVVSHLPLHYTMRNPVEAQKDKGDGTYANYIFDVLNEGGAAGLDIIFLYGHNHAHGWDNYIGGEAVYLPVGDKINIAQESTTVYKEETLNFTYMNAGFVGYYTDECGRDIDNENYLTMTVFEITDSQVLVKRYNQFGEYNLKSVGRRNTHVQSEHKATETMTVNTDTYSSGQTISLAASVPDVTLSDSNETGISVTAPGITGVTASVVEDPSYDAETYSAYVSYDITLEGYTKGNKATVTAPVTAAFDASKPVVVLDQGTQIAKVSIVDGKVTFTTNHFSVYDIAQYAEDKQLSAEGNLSATTFERVTSLEKGVGYLIVPKQGNVLTLTGKTSGKALLLEGGLTEGNDNLWYYDGTYLRYKNATTGAYLCLGSGNGEANLSGSNKINSITLNNDGESFTLGYGYYYGTTYRTYYLNRFGGVSATIAGRYGDDGNKNDGSAWYFYKVVNGIADSVTLTVAPNSLSLMPKATKSMATAVMVGENEATSYTINWASSNTNVATVDSNGVVTGVADGTATITATLTRANGQAVNGTVKVEIPVTVQTKKIINIEVTPMTGSVERGSGTGATTGSTMTVTYDDNTTETILVTVGMLKGTYDLKKNGTYTGLTVEYVGQTVEGYTLNVVDVTGNNFPAYPEEGSVDVTKSAEGQDFQNTGVARVELSTSGLPVKRGVDVVIMLDTSSSMQYDVNGPGNTTGATSRIDALETALTNLLELFQTKDADGNYQDIDIAIADFNGNRNHTIGEDDYFTNVESKINDNNGNVYTNGDGIECNAEDFKDIEDINITNITNQLATASGTNYDWAFETIYKLGAAKQAANGEEERELIVIFMSDGAPFQWNFFHGNGNRPAAVNGVYSDDTWENWITGNMTDANWANYAGGNPGHRHFYNENGQNWMAEAVKGTGDRYPVIYNGTDLGTDASAEYGEYFRYVPGLGATVYAIGLSLFADGNVDTPAIETVMKSVASTDANGNPLYTTAYSEEALDAQFKDIGNKIYYAAQNAYFEDQMGSDFDLQMNPTISKSDGTTTTDISTDITVTSYDVYTKEQVGTTVGGHTVTNDDVGKTYGNGTVLETVRFTSDTAATSTALPGETNIIKDGVICAENFFYNTTTSIKTITFANGSTYRLPGETFYWNIGTINEKQFTLSYAVYLTGSMEGKALPSESYNTNNYATLHYTNWLGNDVEQSVPSPSMPWGGANVSYAFYLVDADGKPVDASGNVVPNIVTAYKVTQPVLYKQINLNAGETVLSTIADDVLPDGYVLYDSDAVYTVNVASGDGSSSWTIAGSYPATTYVTGYAGAQDYSNAPTVSDGSYDYTHTTVYFAVVWTIGTVPDSVVIDYGLPVDISVLINDMFGNNGTLAGVGAYNDSLTYGETLATGFGTSYDGTYGNATINGNKVRYTPASMEMNGYDKFAYAVQYTGTPNPGYYYGTVTVIPATTIYYEDTFVTFAGSNNGTAMSDIAVEPADGQLTSGQWYRQGTTADATQAEDRPGYYSLSYIDANNIYGYDGAYAQMSEHSLDSAARVHVDSSSYATASFSFYGTGFDVISLTSNATGTIVVQVYKNGTRVRNTLVDTYYGMNADGTTTGAINDPESIYQVPVVKISDLEYGKYDVTITATYNTTMDHTSADGYDLYLDAIRIYDPAGTVYGDDGDDGATGSEIDDVIEDAYIADGEGYPVYTELRNNIIAASNYTVTENTDGTVTVSGSNLSGAIFIDCNDAVTSIADYVSYGPNNELYLATNQAIAFNVNVPENVADIQLGIKMANGDPVTYEINGDSYTVSTATDMYYSILKYAKAGTVTIKNVSGGILSLTNIKVTHTSAPATESGISLLSMDAESAGIALMSLRNDSYVEEDVPETTIPEETEPEVTEPEVDNSDEEIKEVVETVKKIVKKLFGWLFG